MQYVGLLPYAIIGLWYVVDTLRNKKFLKKLKPLLMPLLIAGLWFNTKELNIIIAAGLAFGWLGDIFLMTDRLSTTNKKRFVLGVISFVTGHIFYIYYMLTKIGSINMTTLNWVYLGAFVLGALGCLIMLWKDLGNLKAPVIVYEVVLVTVTVIAFNMFLTTKDFHSLLVWLGSMTFLASDAILSFGIFKFEFKIYDFLVMSTYILAQGLIGIGLW